MGTVRFVSMEHVAPGDVAFDRARSAYGRLVSLSTRDDIAHCYVFHRRLGVDDQGRDRWLIAEMSARHGAQFTERVEPPLQIVRTWRLPSEQRRLLEASRRLVRASARYDWLEIGRIVCKLAAGRTLSRHESDRAICVAHVLSAVLAARPDLQAHLPDPTEPTWPGRLLASLSNVQVGAVVETIGRLVPVAGGLGQEGSAA